MHDAPSVTYPVGRSHWGAGIALTLWLAGLVLTVLWSAQPQVTWWRLGAAWTAVAVGGAVAALAWWRTPAGAFAWDGAAWTWSPAGGVPVTGQFRLSLDLQHALLVRWHDEGAGRWFWLERQRRREAWDDLRRAVYSRARPEALPPAEPPAAKP